MTDEKKPAFKVGDRVIVYAAFNPLREPRGIRTIKSIGPMHGGGEDYLWFEGGGGAWCPEACELVEDGRDEAAGIAGEQTVHSRPIPPLGEIDGTRVLLLWEVPDERKNSKWKYEDIADAYAIVENEKADGGIMIYAYYPRHGWMANPWSVRPLVAHLLSRLSERESAGA